MNSDGDDKPKPVDPRDLVRMIDLELAQKRAARKAAGPRWNGLRAASFAFLFVVIVGALLALYFLFVSGRLGLQRTPRDLPPSPAATLASPSPG